MNRLLFLFYVFYNKCVDKYLHTLIFNERGFYYEMSNRWKEYRSY